MDNVGLTHLAQLLDLLPLRWLDSLTVLHSEAKTDRSSESQVIGSTNEAMKTGGTEAWSLTSIYPYSPCIALDYDRLSIDQSDDRASPLTPKMLATTNCTVTTSSNNGIDTPNYYLHDKCEKNSRLYGEANNENGAKANCFGAGAGCNPSTDDYTNNINVVKGSENAFSGNKEVLFIAGGPCSDLNGEYEGKSASNGGQAHSDKENIGNKHFSLELNSSHAGPLTPVYKTINTTPIVISGLGCKENKGHVEEDAGNPDKNVSKINAKYTTTNKDSHNGNSDNVKDNNTHKRNNYDSFPRPLNTTEGCAMTSCRDLLDQTSACFGCLDHVSNNPVVRRSGQLWRPFIAWSLGQNTLGLKVLDGIQVSP
ncbi:unnamed protein product [Protopolystoma xenopodis]|uniref:Uncharacterized protein n=1 Tax=Protopolystoma xenopodis TaxID=117903 RepID=A0A3S5BBM2_9PLAT|nr:unnamed protein product [Protopolystoma xenopodis]